MDFGTAPIQSDKFQPLTPGQDQEPKIAIGSQPLDSPKISVDESNETPKVNRDVATKRSTGWAWALNDTMPMKYNQNDLKSMITTGNEKSLRKTLADNNDQLKMKNLRDKLANMSSLDEIGTDQLLSATRSTDWRYFPESAMAQKFTNTIRNGIEGPLGNTDYAWIYKNQPDTEEGLRRNATDMTWKLNYIAKLKEDYTERQRQVGTGEKIWETFRGFVIPPLDAIRQYGLSGVLGGFGESLAADQSRYFSRDGSVFVDNVSKRAEQLAKIGGPSLALQFLEGMSNLSSDDRWLANAQGWFDLATVPGAGFGLKMLQRGIGATASVIRASRLVEAGIPPHIASEAAAGNVARAGILKAAAVINKEDLASDIERFGDIAPKATPDTITDTLFENWQLRQNKILDNVGSLGTDTSNRIVQSSMRNRSIVRDMLQNTMKVMRMGIAEASEQFAAAAREQFTSGNWFRGPANAIVEFKMPRWDEVRGVHVQPMVLGTENGDPFHTAEQAESWANKMYGLADGQVKFHAWMEPEVPFGMEQHPVGHTVRTPTEDRGPQLRKLINMSNYQLGRITKTLKGPHSFDVEGVKHLQEQQTQLRDAIKGYRQELAAGEWHATGKRPDQPQIKQQGAGYYIFVDKPIREDTNPMRQYLSALADAQMPKGWYPVFLQALVNPDEFMSKLDRTQRKIAQNSQGKILQGLQEIAKDIKSLAKRGMVDRQMWKEFNEVVEQSQRDFPPGQSSGPPGYFAETGGYLDIIYRQLHGRLPTEQEAAAYWAVKDIYEADLVFRNTVKYTMAHIGGFEQWSANLLDRNRERIITPWVTGRVVQRIPSGDVGIAVIGRTPEESEATTSANLGPKGLEKLHARSDEKQVQIIELHAPHTKPLSGWGPYGPNHNIRFVVAPGFQSKALDPQQVPYRSGGHFIPKYGYYIVQPDVDYDSLTDREIYQGTTVAYAIPNKAQGEYLIQHMNAARELRHAGKDAEERAYVQQHLPWDFDTWDGKYKHSRSPNGTVTPPHFRADMPFHVLEHGVDFMNTEAGIALERRLGNKFQDGTRSGNPSKQYHLDFTQERDLNHLQEIRDYGTTDAPSFREQPAEMISPVAAIRRVMNKISGSMFMDSYKVSAVQRWIEQGLALNAFDLDEARIRRAPYAFFNNPKYGTAISDDTRRAMENLRHATRSFTGMASDMDTITTSMMQKLSDQIYTKLGPKVSNKLRDLVPLWELHGVKDPTQFLRSVAFHKSLGLFNPAMMGVHAATVGNGMMMAGARPAIAGTTAGMFHLWASFTNDAKIVDKLDHIISSMGGWHWRPGEWKELHYRLKNTTNFQKEAGTYSFHDEHLTNTLVKGPIGSFLDFAQVFFRTGITMMKTVAWYMSGHELFHGGGGKVFDGMRNFGKNGLEGPALEEHWAAHLERADMLAHNMGRASQGNLEQRWWTKMPLQYSTYFRRLTELTIGTRLTGPERFRLIAGNAMLYGVPASLGLIGFPLDKTIRKAAMENGYTMNQNTAMDMAMNGIPALLIAQITGQWYAVGDRFGPKGLANAVVEDPDLWTIATGAVGTTAQSMWAGASPFVRAMLSMVDGSTEPERWHILKQDVIRAAAEFSTTGNTIRNAVIAFDEGKWFTKRGDLVQDDIPPWSAIIMGATGLRPQAQQDMYLQIQMMQERKALHQDAVKKFVEYMSNAIGAQVQDVPDLDASQQWINRANGMRAFMDPPDVAQAYRLMGQKNQAEIPRVNQEFFNPKHMSPREQERMGE